MRKKLAVILAATLTLQSFAVPAFAADDYSAVEVEEVVQDEVVEESADEVAENYVEPIIEEEDTAVVFDDEEVVAESAEDLGEAGGDFVEVAVEEEAVDEDAEETAEAITTYTIKSSGGQVFNYNSLSDALAAANGGDTITVVGDLEIAAGAQINANQFDSYTKTITIDLTDANVLSTSPVQAVGCGTGISVNDDVADIFVYSPIYYSQDNIVIDYPSTYSTATNNGVQVSFTLANKKTIKWSPYTAAAYATDKTAAIVSRESDIPTTTSDSKFIVLTVTPDGEEPTCTANGTAKLSAKVEFYNANGAVKTKEWETSKIKDYGDIEALGHQYATKDNIVNGVIVMNPFDKNNWGRPDSGVEINWAIRKDSSGDIVVSSDNEGYTEIESAYTKCINNTNHGTGSEAPVWQEVKSAKVISKTAGKASTTSSIGSSIYTVELVTAEDVTIQVRQTVFDVPMKAASKVGPLVALTFETYLYKESETWTVNDPIEEKYVLVSSEPIWVNALYADYTSANALSGSVKAYNKTGTTTTILDPANVFMRTAFSSTGSVNYKIIYQDADNTAKVGTLDGTATAYTDSADSTGHRRTAINECGVNTYFFNAIPVTYVSNAKNGSTSIANIGIDGAAFDPTTTSSLAISVSGTKDNATGVITQTVSSKAFGVKVSENQVTHTVDMSTGVYTVTKAATPYSKGSATITCKHCGKSVSAEIPELSTGIVYELSNGMLSVADDVQTAMTNGTYTMSPTCEKGGYKYYWSVDLKAAYGDRMSKFEAVSGSAISATAKKTDYFEVVQIQTGVDSSGNPTYDYTLQQLTTSSVINTNATYYKVKSGLTPTSQTGDTQNNHVFAGIKVEISGTETAKLEHKWNIAKPTSDIKWYDSNGHEVANNATPAYCEITWTCANANLTTNVHASHVVKYYLARSTTADTETEKWGAITKSIVDGADCTEESKQVYTVNDVTDIFGNAVQYQIPYTGHYGSHDFIDELNWSEDGKSATVTRTCQNSDCKEKFNTTPKVATAVVTSKIADDGAFVYTASLDGEELGTKTVYDLTKARITVNGGTAVDNNLLDNSTASKMVPVTVTLNGVELSTDLYSVSKAYVNITKNDATRFRDSADTGWFDVTEIKTSAIKITKKADTEAYGSQYKEYNVLNNGTFVDTVGHLFSGTALTIDAKAWPVSKQIEYDGNAHKIGISAVYKKNWNKATTFNGWSLAGTADEFTPLKDLSVKYAISTKSNSLDATKLEYSDALEITDAGKYYIYVSLEAKNYTPTKAYLTALEVTKADLTEYVVAPSAKTITYGETTFAFTTGDDAIDKELGLTTARDVSKLSVGSYSLSGLYKDNGNYKVRKTWMSSADGESGALSYDNELVIEKRNAKIVLADKTWEYTGVEVDPQTLFTVDGVLEGDDLGVVVNTEGNRKLVEPGTYKLIATANNANYDVKEVTATVTITPKTTDQAEAQKVIDQINKLTATSSDAEVKAARDAYDKLTATQKTIVSADTLKKLTDAEAAQKAQTPEQKAAVAAADTAAANPTDDNIKKAADAIAAAKAKGADTTQAEAALAKARETNATNAANAALQLANAAKTNPTTANIDAAQKAVTAANAKLAYMNTAAKANLTSATNALADAKKQAAKVTITFGNAKVKKALNSAGTKTSRIKIKKGKKLRLKAKSSNGATITYKAGNKKVTVNAKGVITAKKAGKSKVTVTCGNTKVQVLLKITKK